MENYEFKKYLEETIRERIDSIGESAQFFQSLVGTSKNQKRVSISDLETGLNCYKGIVEIVTLMRFYNRTFGEESETGLRELKSRLEPTLKSTEGTIREMFKTLLEKVQNT